MIIRILVLIPILRNAVVVRSTLGFGEGFVDIFGNVLLLSVILTRLFVMKVKHIFFLVLNVFKWYNCERKFALLFNL